MFAMDHDDDDDESVGILQLILLKAVSKREVGTGNGIQMSQVIIAGGSGTNCGVIFDVQSGALTNEVGLVQSTYGDQANGGKQTAETSDGDLLERNRSLNVGNIAKMVKVRGGVYCVDFDPLGEYVVYGGDNDKVGVARDDVGKTSCCSLRSNLANVTKPLLQQIFTTCFSFC